MKYLCTFLYLFSSIVFANNVILSLEKAITLAHVKVDGKDHTVAVLYDNGNYIKGIDITNELKQAGSPLLIYNQLGYENLRSTIEKTDYENVVTLPYKNLLSPAGEKPHHIALGLNYKEHADEVNEESKPFIFIKYTKPTREETIQYEQNRLLDYEVELCARPIKTIDDYLVSDHEFAFFLCGDFTDRASLIRNIDLNNIQSGKGFSLAKSVQGYFPTGPYLVIPKNQADFLQHTEISLSLNGQQKQKSLTKDMIWQLPKFMGAFFNLIEEDKPTYSVAASWLPKGEFDNEINILTGTPEGVLMNPPNLWYKIKTGVGYFMRLKFLESYHSVREYVLEAFIKEQFDNKTFLQPGDKILLSATGMGVINLSIE